MQGCSHVIAERVLTAKTSDGFLVATAKLYRLGDQVPYFSVTAELWDSEGWYRNGQDGRMRECGCLHDRILAAFPDLAPIVSLHLSDEGGAPMHAVANGWYWYEQAQSGGHEHDYRDILARHLRVNAADIPEGLTRETFAEYVATLRPRWQDEAAAALAYLKEDA